ncbi:uncharacterized protein LOC108625802 isoform X2 [Ceratina calcarata]|uniref:Uncharacterized protein LOC108625802 isoform X2 n=1 Tax=Ceratina calcarata TaxID=156304 RepID=A0AAJ7N830_9HYME|nr:uncharacterized protein LOC108625802 isoform X2 [Ceratina calcarata]
MPWCVVKKCVSNNDKQSDKISTFKVPNDQDLREKWRVAIGVNILRSSHRVCELHFEEHLVIKDYIHRTKDGHIIAQVPLKHHHLKAGAVPAIFKRNDLLRERSPPKFQKCINDIMLDHCYATKRISECLQNVDRFDISVAKSERSKDDIDSRMQEETSCNVISSIKTETTDCDKDAAQKKGVLEENPQDICKVEAENNFNYAIDVDSSCPLTTNKIECSRVVDDSISKSEERRDNVTCEKPVQTHNNAVNGIRINSTQFCINVTFNFSTPCKLLKCSGNNTVENDVEIKLPKPWGLQKSVIGKEEVLIFTYVVESTDSGIQTHIFEKSVLIKSSREIIYEVFSRKVNVSESKLPKILNDFKILPEILKKFKDFKICKGVPDTIPNFFQTSVSRTVTGMDIRHKDCSLLSYNCEKCRSCKVYSTSIARSLKQSKQKKEVIRVSSSKNATEQCKIKALRNKIKRQQEHRRRLKFKLSLLTDAIADR